MRAEGGGGVTAVNDQLAQLTVVHGTASGFFPAMEKKIRLVLLFLALSTGKN
jgi:hypothetical protein